MLCSLQLFFVLPSVRFIFYYLHFPFLGTRCQTDISQGALGCVGTCAARSGNINIHLKRAIRKSAHNGGMEKQDESLFGVRPNPQFVVYVPA